MKAHLTAKVDWLEFTIKNHTATCIIENLLLLSEADFTALPKGRYGYSHQLKWSKGNLFVLYNEDESPLSDMGVHVLLSGSGCDTYSVHRELLDLMQAVVCHQCYKFTRIDLAIDDMQGELLVFDRIHHHATAGLYTSRWAVWNEVLTHKTSDNTYVGRTLYFGSRSSDIFCRVYDKTLEQLYKHRNDEEEALEIPEKWTRLEIVYKKERATLLAEHLSETEDLGVALRETLNNYIRFLEPTDTDVNRSRWPSAPWWATFIDEAGQLSLTTTPADRSIEDMRSWIERQISPTLATILLADKGEMGWLKDALVTGKGRLKPKHYEAIEQYLNDLSDQMKED